MLLCGALGVDAGMPPSLARADIFVCQRGAVQHYTNQKPKGETCRRLVKSTAKAPALSSQGQRTVLGAEEVTPLLSMAAERYALPEALLRAVMRTESAFVPTAVSPKGATGLMQLMPKTAAAMGVQNITSPKENVLGGARYLRLMLNRFGGDLMLALAAYNAGESAVEKYGGIPPYPETQRYVRRVMEAYIEYASATPLSQRGATEDARVTPLASSVDERESHADETAVSEATAL